MNKTKVLQEIRLMKFTEAYEWWALLPNPLALCRIKNSGIAIAHRHT